MNLSAPFIRRPIGTILLTLGVALAGVAAVVGQPQPCDCGQPSPYQHGGP